MQEEIVCEYSMHFKVCLCTLSCRFAIDHVFLVQFLLACTRIKSGFSHVAVLCCKLFGACSCHILQCISRAVSFSMYAYKVWIFACSRPLLQIIWRVQLPYFTDWSKGIRMPTGMPTGMPKSLRVTNCAATDVK